MQPRYRVLWFSKQYHYRANTKYATFKTEQEARQAAVMLKGFKAPLVQIELLKGSETVGWKDI